jgi:hypothetical protein
LENAYYKKKDSIGEDIGENKEKIQTLLNFLRDLSLQDNVEQTLPELPDEDPFSELFWMAQVMQHDIKESFEQIRNLNQKYKEKNLALIASLDEIKTINKKLEKARDKARESDRLKTAFLQNLSHEIRTPMNGILGFTDLLKSTKLSPEKQDQYITMIEESGQRMLGIIHDLVDISKIESGQTEIIEENTNVNELLDNVYGMFTREATKKGLRLTVRKGITGKGCITYTDKTKLCQILINLVKNAIKYTEEGGVLFGYNRKGHALEFFVQDTGIGIEPYMGDKIFNRFQRANHGTDSSYEGAGLGLAIAKAYVELLGGEIWYKSEMDKGSAFFFTIPWQTPRELSNPGNGTENVNPLDKPRKSILIAEDDITSLKYFEAALESENLEIWHAKNGMDAVEIVRKIEGIEIVLMDIKMPVMDGLEATREIKKMKPMIPVVALTAYAMSNDKQEALGAGCDDYITKPVNIKQLKRMLNQYLYEM